MILQSRADRYTIARCSADVDHLTPIIEFIDAVSVRGFVDVILGKSVSVTDDRHVALSTSIRVWVEPGLTTERQYE
jgi:hypothetical protein